jgi:hypothetical protein
MRPDENLIEFTISPIGKASANARDNMMFWQQKKPPGGGFLR